VGEEPGRRKPQFALRAPLQAICALHGAHNDAASTIDRLVNIGVEPYLIANRSQGDHFPAAGPAHLSPLPRRVPGVAEELTLGMKGAAGVRLYRARLPMCFGTVFGGAPACLRS
jgi:type IV pilus assembly protein PilB